MAGIYNPNDPRTVGVEWPAGRDYGVPLAHNYGRAALFDSNATQEIDAARLYIATRTGGAYDQTTGQYVIDLYDGENLQGGQLAQAVSVPAALQFQSGSWLTAPATGDYVGAVNQWPVSGADANAAVFVNDPNLQGTDPRVGTIRFKLSPTFREASGGTPVDLSDKRILSMAIGGWMAAANPWNISTGALANMEGTGADDDWYEGGNWAAGQVAADGVPVYKSYATSSYRKGSARGGHDLIPADVEALTTDGPGWIGLWCAYVFPGGPGFVPWSYILYSLHLYVTYGIERRIATGYGSARTMAETTGPGDWVNFPFIHPATNDPITVTKEAGKRYVLVARQLPYMLNGNDWRGLDATTTRGYETALMPAGLGSRNIAFENSGPLGYPGLPDASQTATPDGTRMQAYTLMSDGVAIADGSQPYVRPVSCNVWNRATVRVLGFSHIEAHTLAQQLPITNDDDQYGVVSVIIKNHGYMDRFSAPLVVTLKRTGDPAELARVEFTFADLKAPTMGDGLWYIVQKRIGGFAPALVAGEQYVLEASSETEHAAWELLTISAEDAVAGAIGFAGTDNGMIVADTVSTQYGAWDALLRLSTLPDQLSNVRATPETFDAGPLAGSCTLDEIYQASVTWTPSDDPEFASYEVERSEDRGATWSVVAQLVGDRNVARFADQEMPRNFPVRYRVRQYRTDGIWSDPVEARGLGLATESVTIAIPDGSSTFPTAWVDEGSFRWRFTSSTCVITEILDEDVTTITWGGQVQWVIGPGETAFEFCFDALGTMAQIVTPGDDRIWRRSPDGLWEWRYGPAAGFREIEVRPFADQAMTWQWVTTTGLHAGSGSSTGHDDTLIFAGFVPPAGGFHTWNVQTVGGTATGSIEVQRSTASSSTDIIVPIEEWGIVLSSNLLPARTRAYYDEPGYVWEQVDAGRMEMRYFMGTDHGLMLRETEFRGETFTRTLIVAFDDPAMLTDPTRGGRAAFDDLLAIAHARNIPYVVVADHRGRRWYTAPSVRELIENEPGGQYLAEVDFTEVQGPAAV